MFFSVFVYCSSSNEVQYSTYTSEGAEKLRCAAWACSRRDLLSLSFLRRSPGSSLVNCLGLAVLTTEEFMRNFWAKLGSVLELPALINLRISLWISSYSSLGGVIPPVLKTRFPDSNSRWTLRTSFRILPAPISGSSLK